MSENKEINTEENIKQRRCPNGERFNTKTKRCEKKKPKKYTFKRGQGIGQVGLLRTEKPNVDLQKDAQTIPEAISSLSNELTGVHPFAIHPPKETTDSTSSGLTKLSPTIVKESNIIDTVNESIQPLQQHPIEIVKSKKKVKIVKPQQIEQPIDDTMDYNKMTGQELRDLWASLMGLPLGQKTSGKFSKKAELIQEIIRLKQERQGLPPSSDTISMGNVITDPTVMIPEEPFQKELSPSREATAARVEEVAESTVEEVNVIEEREPEVIPITEPFIEDDIPEEKEEENEKDKIKNKELFEMEKQQYESAKTDTSYEFLYPEINDPNFNIKIAKRKEFNDTKYDGTIYDIKKQADILCNAEFELMPHQLFVKNFLSFQTPYNSLLLFNSLGTGKTCSAIGIAEEMRKYMKQIGLSKKILVIASPNVQENFKMQLFDESRLQEENGLWKLNTCVGNSLLSEINPTNLKGIPREKVISQMNSIRNSFYSFLGYTEFANYITKKTMVSEESGFTEKEKSTYETKKIRKVFNNSLIIIDEVHNLRITDDNKNKRTATLLMKVAKYANNLRLLLLSATPMYNSYKEILWLLNLMNINDKRSTISEDEIFDKEGNFLIERNENGIVKEGGRELLLRKLIGYVSYVRGENPYTFPFRIYPDLFSPENVILRENYPKVQMNKKPIETPIQHVPVFVSKIGEYQQKGYDFIMENMRKRSFNKSNSYGDETIMPTFENMERFGYTLLEVPLESLNIVYPNQQFDDFLLRNQEKEIPYNQEEYTEIIANIIGKRGLSNIMTYDTIKSPQPMRFNFDYKPEVLASHGKIFARENISKYSNKIGKFCDCVLNSKGILIIYSQYIDGGCVPIALALEEMGFARYCSEPTAKSLLKTPAEPIDAMTMKPKSQVGSEFKQAKYVMITGDPNFSPNNANDIKYITKKENKNGELVKVIIISKAASEGLDFKNVRQVHIMEPWYNMNRIEQIIGRGVRNLSHCGLPFEDRNVEIYLHGTIPSNDEEPADLYVYRLAEKKALQIGKVTRVLKESAADCLLNIGQMNFTVDKMMALAENSNIKINLSSKKEPIEFKFGDKDFTDVCDYMECQKDFKCSPHTEPVEDKDVIKDTYSEEYVKMNYPMILKRIRQLYKEQSFYKKDKLFEIVNLIKKYPDEQIYYCLSELINNKNEYLIDRYGRRGYLINRGEYYAFQPIEITDENASIFERDVPVDYKRDSMLLELQKDVVVDSIKQPTISLAQIDNAEQGETIAEPIGSRRSYEDILKEIEISVNAALNLKTVDTGDTDWYNHVSQVLDIVKDVHKIPLSFLTKYIIYHYLDCLELIDRLTIINKFYSIDFNRDNEKVIEKMIRDYFEDKIVTHKTLRAIVLADMKTIKLYILKGGKWVEARQVDREKFTQQINERFLVNKESINTFVGFMSVFKNQSVMFKTKDLSQTRNNIGAVCSQSGKADIIKRLNAVIEENIYFIKKTDSILKIGMCAILELVLRYFTESNYKGRGRIYFMDSERALLNKVSEL
jgi:superfamily II DNA or RNA helicase